MMLPPAGADGRVRGADLAWAADRCSSRLGYLAAWTAYGLVAYALLPARYGSFDPAWLAWDRGGPYATGAVLVVAGLYELTPLKAACLRRCRSVEQDAGDRRSPVCGPASSTASTASGLPGR